MVFFHAQIPSYFIPVYADQVLIPWGIVSLKIHSLHVHMCAQIMKRQNVNLAWFSHHSSSFHSCKLSRSTKGLLRPLKTDLFACTFCFPNTDHVMIPWGIISFSARAYVRINYEKIKIKFTWKHHVICIGKQNLRGKDVYRVFPRDVTVAMLVSLNKGTAAILVSPTNTLGIEPYFYANVFFCFG